MDYQNGRICKYGTTALKNLGAHSSFVEACSKTIGFSFIEVFLADVWANIGFQRPGCLPKELHKDFAACLYWAHTAALAFSYMMHEEVLHEDGTTDGGCEMATVVPDSQCPVRTGAHTFFVIVAIASAVVVCLLGACIYCCLGRKTKEGYTQLDNKSELVASP
jgi:hypothetical protein